MFSILYHVVILIPSWRTFAATWGFYLDKIGLALRSTTAETCKQ